MLKKKNTIRKGVLLSAGKNAADFDRCLVIRAMLTLAARQMYLKLLTRFYDKLTGHYVTSQHRGCDFKNKYMLRMLPSVHILRSVKNSSN